MSEIEPVTWGVLGVAKIATTKVIPAMQRGRWSRVAAIASRDLAKARAAAEALGIPRAYGSYEELIADAGVEAVYNPLPNHLHVPWSVRAAEAGKHVLCEKPIALDASEARTLLEARERTGVWIGEAFMVRTHPQWHAVREIVASGRIGALRLVVGHFSYPKRKATDIRSRVEWGGGALLDIGCYPIMLSRWLFGAEPIRVAAAIDRDPETGVDRLTSGVLEFAAGQASFTCSSEMGAHQRVVVYGTTGRVEIAVPFTPPNDVPTRLLVDDGRDPSGSPETIELDAVDQYTLQGDQFSLAVRGRGAVPVSLEDAIDNMTVIDALFRSAESGRWEAPARG